MNVARSPASSAVVRVRSRSGRSTACTSAIEPSCGPPPTQAAAASWRRRSSRSTRTRGRCSASGVELLATLERRLELLAAAGVEDVLVVEFSPEIAGLEPEEFAQQYLLGIGRAGRRRRHGVPLRQAPGGRSASSSASLGLDARQVPLVEGVSSTRIRQLAARRRRRGRGTPARPAARGGRDGRRRRPARRHARIPDGEPRGRSRRARAGLRDLRRGRRRAPCGDLDRRQSRTTAARERRIEAYLLDWTGDLYGDRLVVELWRRLRDERAFESEAELVAQIARDVEETRAAHRPV